MLNRRSARARQGMPASEIPWLPYLLLLLLIGYWVFAHFLERIDLAPMLAIWWGTWAPFPLPQPLVFIVEMLHPRVLRHLIAVLVGWQLAYRTAVSLVQRLYDLPDRSTAGHFLSRLLSRRPPPGRPMPVNEAVLAEEREESILLRVGGPGRIFVANGDVAVTEMNGRFHRILGPGVHTLSRLEYIHTVLDVRPQERTVTEVPLTTLDGIYVHADVTVTFRLDTGGEPITRDKPYPFSEAAVRQAAYQNASLPAGKVSHWDNAPINNARRILTDIIAHYRLDEILHARAAAEPYHAIRSELIQKLRPSLANQGIELTGLHIGRLELPEEVTGQYLDYWKTSLTTQIRLNEADGKATRLEEMEIARAEAEMTMIQAIVEGVQRARREHSPHNMDEIVALRLIEALEKMARQTQQIQSLPESLLPRINALRQDLLPGGETPSPAETAD